MRIGITCYPTYGGSGVVATELGLELAARGHEVHFISYAVPVRMTEAAERIHFHEVEMLNYPLFDHPPYALALATMMHNVAVNESLDPLRRDALGGKGVERVEQRPRGIVRRRDDLCRREPAVRGNRDRVGERAAHVDAHRPPARHATARKVGAGRAARRDASIGLRISPAGSPGT